MLKRTIQKIATKTKGLASVVEVPSMSRESIASHSEESTSTVAKSVVPVSEIPVVAVEPEVDPILSVIVPCYKVEQYLKGTLDTILAQNEIPIEIIVVDDGSPDRSGEIAREYAYNDSRVKVISQDNAGLGAARNTGIRAATAKYLTFADSDDYIPVGAYKAMVDQLESSGSDFVVGSVERRRGLKTWIPEWAQNVHSEDRIAGTLADDPELLKDVFAWNKVFRRTFWDEHIKEFPVDIRYEDQGPTAIAYTTSEHFDVLKRVVYTWVIREDGTSITQQKAKIEDLQDRMAVMKNVGNVLRQNSSSEIFEKWLLKSIGFDLKPYYDQIPRTDEAYWNELILGIRFLDEFMTEELWNEVPYWERIIALSLLNGRQSDVSLILQKKQEDGAGYAILPGKNSSLVCHTDFLPDLSFDVDRNILVPAESSIRLRADLLGVKWIDEGSVIEAIIALRISGMSPNVFDYDVLARLIPLNHDGEPVELTAMTVDVPVELVPIGDSYNSYHEAVYSVKIDTKAIQLPVDTSTTDLKWAVETEVHVANIVRSGNLTGRVILGSGTSFGHGRLAQDVRFALDFDEDHGLVVNVPTVKPICRSINLDGRNLVLRVDKRSAGDFDRLVLRSKHRRDVSFLVSMVTEDELIFDVSLPLFDDTLVGSALWELRLANRHSSSLIQSSQSSNDLLELSSHGRRLRVSLSPNGFVRLEEKDFGISVHNVRFNEERDELTLEGRYGSPHAAETRLYFESSSNHRILPHSTEFDKESGLFSARFILSEKNSGESSLALPEGGYALKASKSRLTLGSAEVWIPVDYSLQVNLPIHSMLESSRVRLSRTAKAGALWLNIYPRLSFGDTTKFGQRNAREIVSSTGSSIADATLFESFAGNAIADSPLALFEEAQRRGFGGTHYWTVRDLSVPVPTGSIPVVLHSAEYRRVLSTSRWLVNNNNFPYYFAKTEGQIYIQTWHGTPLKKIGNDVPAGNLSVSYRSLMKRESAYWDLLLAQNDFSAERLAQAFGYSGKVLSTGYPRNDALVNFRNSVKMDALRSQLGILPNQHVVLYAPTWRDNMRTASNHYDLVSFLDFSAMKKAFGSSVVILMRGHSNTVDARRQFNFDNVIDVSKHPNINDLMLISDSLVTDYSSIMFDFCSLNRPIFILAPDIDDYASSTRGFYFDFRENLPGPLLDSTQSLISLLKADPLAYLYRVRNYSNQFAPNDDGMASRRVADTIWGSK
ncbi:CDP-glycerol glycerophosphotransferase family protein [Glutamicibacter sp. NPDC087344]|uniref:bifunctional glycosyltransferase/CDP-glycerol:glycerophosphate glycerophosphotransferase n=1 Tax=Glutamicibacter sp. NPDC087344 TaxID=3363994 RepID=UPI0038297C0D